MRAPHTKSTSGLCHADYLQFVCTCQPGGVCGHVMLKHPLKVSDPQCPAGFLQLCDRIDIVPSHPRRFVFFLHVVRRPRCPFYLTVGAGVGDASASATHALLVNVLQDVFSRLTSMFFVLHRFLSMTPPPSSHRSGLLHRFLAFPGRQNLPHYRRHHQRPRHRARRPLSSAHHRILFRRQPVSPFRIPPHRCTLSERFTAFAVFDCRRGLKGSHVCPFLNACDGPR